MLQKSTNSIVAVITGLKRYVLHKNYTQIVHWDISAQSMLRGYVLIVFELRDLNLMMEPFRQRKTDKYIYICEEFSKAAFKSPIYIKV